MRFSVVLLAMVLSSGQVAAQDYIRLGRPNADNVFVWRDRAAQKEAFRRIQAGITKADVPAILLLTACVVPKGTPAKIIDTVAAASYQVEIATGVHTGCAGVVQQEDTGIHG